MSWTDAEKERVRTLEEAVNKVQIAIKNRMSSAEMRQLLLIKQQEVDALTDRVKDLETQLKVLQSRLD